MTDAEQQGAEALGQQARALFLRGREAYFRGDFEAALKQFRAAYELAEGRPRVFMLVNIAEALDRLGRENEALRYYEQYLELAPDGPNAGMARSRVRVLRQRRSGSPTQASPRRDRSAPASEPAAGEGEGAPRGSAERGGSATRPRPEPGEATGQDEAGEPARPEPLAPAPGDATSKTSGGSPWPWVDAGGALLVAGAVVAVVLLSGEPAPVPPEFAGVTVGWDVETLR